MEFKVVKRGLGENRKYYFKGPDGKIYGEGYDSCYFHREKMGRKRLAVVEGFARVRKGDWINGRWYLVDVDNGFKLYSEHSYEYIRLLSEGWAEVNFNMPNVVRGKGYIPYCYINLKQLRETGVLHHYTKPVFNFARRIEGGLYMNIKELEETGSSHDYKYDKYREGFNIVYEKGQYYFIDEDFKLHGEGYDDANNFRGGFAAVKKGGKWYYVDKNFELHGEGYDDVDYFSGGFAKVKKDGKWYYVDKNFELHGEGYDDADYFSGGFAVVKKGGDKYTINENFERIKRNNQIMEDVDYLQEAKDDVKSIVGIPAIRFSDDFVNKLKAIVLNHYEKEVEEAKSDKVEALRSEMEYIKKIIDEKKEQYSEKVADPNYQSLLKQAQSLFEKSEEKSEEKPEENLDEEQSDENE